MMPTRQPAKAKQSGGVKPFTQAEIGEWRSRLTAGREIAKDLVLEGRKSVARYTAHTLKTKPKEHTVVVPLDYASVEQKKAQLFQVPEMIAEGRTPEAEPMAPLFAAIANYQLGPEGVNASAMMFEAQTDVLIQGYAVTKIGYENVVDGTKPVETGRQIPDPNFQQSPGAILGLQPAPMVPETVDAPNIISETYYWRRIPPGFLLVDAEFRGSNFDESPFLAWRFSEDVPDSELGGGHSETDDELLLVQPDRAKSGKRKKRYGTEGWYKACLFDADCKHPDLVRTFKLYDNDEKPAERRNSPFQRWAVPGQPLSVDYLPGSKLVGMKGYPLHILTLRYTPDSAFPLSDVQMGGILSDEISTGRTQVLRRRDRSLPQTGYDATRVTPADLAKIEKNENSAFIGFNGPIDDSMFKQIDKGQFGRENFAFNDQAQQDYDKAWAHGAHGGVLKADSPETATKTQSINHSIENRLQMERTRELEWFVAGATKLMSLYQIFADAQDYAPIVGATGQQRLQAWDKTMIPGPFILKTRPNSHIRLNPEQDFRQDLELFNLAGNAPEGNRMYMLQRLFMKRGWDPARALQQPPPKQADAATGSVSLKVEDFVGPGAPVAQILARALGIEVPDATLAAAGLFGQLWAQHQAEQAQMAAEQKAAGGPKETEHGGAMATMGETAPINKHQADKTGGVQGIGV